VSEGAEEPRLRIITPNATDEEIAAIVAVVSALGSGSAESPKKTPSTWSAAYRQTRVHYSHGPGGWRASGMPQHRGR
jgi:hypothetical protein